MYPCRSQGQVQWRNHPASKSITLLLILISDTVIDYHAHMAINRWTQSQDLSPHWNNVRLWEHEPNVNHQKPGGGSATQDKSWLLLQGLVSPLGLCNKLTCIFRVSEIPQGINPERGCTNMLLFKNPSMSHSMWTSGMKGSDTPNISLLSHSQVWPYYSQWYVHVAHHDYLWTNLTAIDRMLHRWMGRWQQDGCTIHGAGI